MNYDFKNLNILITGGTSGIGGSISKSLIKCGANVFVLSRRKSESWDIDVPDMWNKSNLIVQDLTDLNSLESNMSDIIKIMSNKIDVLILSAVYYGIGRRHSLCSTSLDEWNDIFKVNVFSQSIILKHVLPIMNSMSKALILAISSEVAVKNAPGRIAYGASKAASNSIMKSLKEEISSQNISIVQLLPLGMVATPGIKKRRDEDFDFSEYASSDSFLESTLEIIKNMGQEYNNMRIIIDNNGISYIENNY